MTKQQERRQEISTAKRWVIKIGSALLTKDGEGLDYTAIASWVEQMSVLRARGIEIILVSSGAVAAGMTRLGWQTRPTYINELQAAAAVGQTRLIQMYETEFARYDLWSAQVLLDHDDLSSRERYLNARSTLKALLELGVVAIVNENDTVVTDEIRFGDNDTLGALVANLTEADLLVIMTDQLGMFDRDPRTDSRAKIISEAAADDKTLDAMATGGGALGRGGMTTKVSAARVAARSGADTLIVGGRQDDVLTRIADGECLGTYLWAGEEPQAARKRWLAGHLQTCGALILDNGAVRALQNKGRSLLPVGVRSVIGDFTRGDIVVCVNAEGREIARGLVNYHADEARQIIGRESSEISSILGYQEGQELIHRDNLVLTA